MQAKGYGTTYTLLALMLLSTMALVGYLLYTEKFKHPNFTQKPYTSVNKTIQYDADVQPILNRKCVSCHGCYDAPCQLKLVSGKGVMRGATQIPVYNAKRIDPATPTRLHLDGRTEQDWRALGFYSVISTNNKRSLLESFIDWGYSNKDTDVRNAINSKELTLGPNREAQCVKSEAFNRFTHDQPHSGMPLAVTGLTKNEYNTIKTWFEQGAQISSKPWLILKEDKAVISQWESWLNETSKKRKLVARYLYEHLFLGHLYLDSDRNISERIVSADKKHTVQFYRLVRSRTPPGHPIRAINTALPNEAPTQRPGDPFYYRLQPIEETLVYKTHIAYRFDTERLNELTTLFSQEDWTVTSLPDYDYQHRANPFKTFAAIPASLRYKFLLQDAEYFVRSFIRGPVCHGPIATDVIRDQFWVMFENPDTELYTNDESYRRSVTDLLGLPGENADLQDFADEWDKYQTQRNQYADLRQIAYARRDSSERSLDSIWHANDRNPNAFLTVFRHHDSAAVRQGWLGEFPRTAWVLDYPLFERAYYELVVGFNVFGNMSHQLQTRLYFDLIRHGGETNLLGFIPPENRQQLYDQWYQGLAQLKNQVSYAAVDLTAPGSRELSGDAPYKQFFDLLFKRYPQMTQAFDPINRAGTTREVKDAADHRDDTKLAVDSALAKIASTPLASAPFVDAMPDFTLLLVTSQPPNYSKPQKPTHDTANIYSVIRNRMHSNVAFMLGEDLRYQPQLDSLTILNGMAGSYPNLILSINADQIERFISTLESVKTIDTFRSDLSEFILHRMDDNFWDTLHDIVNINHNTHPIHSGLLDINRYGYW